MRANWAKVLSRNVVANLIAAAIVSGLAAAWAFLRALSPDRIVGAALVAFVVVWFGIHLLTVLAERRGQAPTAPPEEAIGKADRGLNPTAITQMRAISMIANANTQEVSVHAVVTFYSLVRLRLAPSELVLQGINSSGTICDLKAAISRTPTEPNTWLPVNYAGTIKVADAGALLRAIRATMKGHTTDDLPSAGPVFVEVEIGIPSGGVAHDQYLESGVQFGLPPQHGGERFTAVVKIANWPDGVPQEWRNPRSDSRPLPATRSEPDRRPTKHEAITLLLTAASEEGKLLVENGNRTLLQRWGERTKRLIADAYGDEEAGTFMGEHDLLGSAASEYWFQARRDKLLNLIQREKYLAVRPEFDPQKWQNRSNEADPGGS